MLVSIIAAMDRHGLIGDEAGLPWRLPKDLQRFRAYTWGKPIIVGRRTFELIGKPLPGRFNIILTQNPDYRATGCRVARTFQEALSIAENYLESTGGDEVMIIGGAKVYEEAIHRWNRLYLTIVEGEFKGNTYFPVRALLRQSWHPVCAPESYPPDEKNPHRHSFHIIERARDTAPPSPQGEANNLSGYTDLENALESQDLATLLERGSMGS
jgi:dihydrofolate reductase